MSQETSEAQGFYRLTPDYIQDSLEAVGFRSNGFCIPLNSYENRVYEIHLESPVQGHSKVVTKFYRPGRWSADAILEEHEFLKELHAEGIPVVVPMAEGPDNDTLFDRDGIYFCVFPKSMGRMPQEFLRDDLKRVGRRLAQIHNVGARRMARDRPTLNVETFGQDSLQTLEHWIWPDLRRRYQDLGAELVESLDKKMSRLEFLRIHGDCHRGNLLDNGSEFYFVDFDDFMNGPAVQDFWMLAGGDEEQDIENRNQLMSGYLELRDFNELDWLAAPLLRGLRLIHYSAWIARRWEDPSFPRLFPDFNTYLYWLEECDQLQKALLSASLQFPLA